MRPLCLRHRCLRPLRGKPQRLRIHLQRNRQSHSPLAVCCVYNRPRRLLSRAKHLQMRRPPAQLRRLQAIWHRRLLRSLPVRGSRKPSLKSGSHCRVHLVLSRSRRATWDPRLARLGARLGATRLGRLDRLARLRHPLSPHRHRYRLRPIQQDLGAPRRRRHRVRHQAQRALPSSNSVQKRQSRRRNKPPRQRLVHRANAR